MRSIVLALSCLLLAGGCGPIAYGKWKDERLPTSLSGDEESLRELLDTEVDGWSRTKLAGALTEYMLRPEFYSFRARQQVRWDLVALLVQWEPEGAIPKLVERYRFAVGGDASMFPEKPKLPADEYFAKELETILAVCPSCGLAWAWSDVSYFTLSTPVYQGHVRTLEIALGAAGDRAGALCGISSWNGYGLLDGDRPRDPKITKLLEGCGASKRTPEEAAEIKAEMRAERRRQDEREAEEQRQADIEWEQRVRADNERYRREVAAQRRSAEEWNRSQAAQNAPTTSYDSTGSSAYGDSTTSNDSTASNDSNGSPSVPLPEHVGPIIINKQAPPSKTAPPPPPPPAAAPSKPTPQPSRPKPVCPKGGCTKAM